MRAGPGAAHLDSVTTTTLPRPAVDLLADLPVGATFSVNGKTYRMADGFEVQPAAGRGWFNVIDTAGRFTRLVVRPKTRVEVHVSVHRGM